MLPIPPIETALAAFRDEMRPFPGRAARSARMAIVVVLVTVASMALQTPETAVSCYLVFFAAKEDAASTVLQSLKLIFGALFGIAFGLVFLMVSADEPVIRLALMAVFSFAGMFFAHASRLGPIASTVGFVLALAVTLFDIVPVPELLTRGLVWMWAIVAMPMAILLLVDAVAGTRADAHVRAGLAERLEAIADLLAAPSGATRRRVEAMLADGDEAARERLRAGRILSAIRSEETARLADLLDLSFRLAAVATSRLETAAEPALAARLLAAARGLGDRRIVAPPPAGSEDGAGLVTGAMADLVGRIEARVAGVVPDDPMPPPAKEPLLAADAFSDPIHVRFALKTTLAAMVCYGFYTATDWFGIHTALVTCYFVALSSLGETVHKLMLRIVGALIGAGLGIFALVVLMPRMTDIGHLALLVGSVSFLAAWISNGSPRISYMGWQIALAFFLCVLHGHGPTADLIVARDRVLGILIGNLVMSAIFTTIWPVGVGEAARRALDRAAAALAALAADRGRAVPMHLVERFERAQGEVRRVLALRLYEPRAVATDAAGVAVLARGLSRLESLAGPVLLLRCVHGPAEAADLLPPAVTAAERAGLDRTAGYLGGPRSDMDAAAAAEAGPSPHAAMIASLAAIDAPPSALVEISERLRLVAAMEEREQASMTALEALEARTP